MLFTQKKHALVTARKLHSIHALLQARAFVGKIEAGKLAFDFIYNAQAAALVGNKLELTGKVTIMSPAGKTTTAENVKATLRGVQSAMNSATKPASFGLTVPSAFPVDPPDDKPLTELTNTRSAVGVMYLALSALDGKALGVPYDLSAVQLNGRLAVADQTGRDLQWLFNETAAALDRTTPNPQMAEPYISEIDRKLRA